MYTCNACGGDFPFLIFEYNSLVCEACSLHKNIKNCGELEAMMEALPSLEPETAIESEEDELEDAGEEIGDDDVTQLFELIAKITNPHLRADFKDLAAQYFEGELG